MQAILAVGAGSLAVNAVKGLLGGGDKADDEISKHAEKASSSSNDSISKALESLRKSGKAHPMCATAQCIPFKMLELVGLIDLLQQSDH